MLKFWKSMNSLLEKCVMIVFMAVFMVVIYSAYDTWYIYDHASDDSLLNYKPGQADVVMADSPITEDMVAWLTVEDTSIDYPIMQGTDNTKYLNTDPYGSFSLSGSIFLDSRNSADFSDEYSLIYGHHMEYGNMFGSLDEFLDGDYLQAHRNGQIIVGADATEVLEIEIFRADHVDANDSAVFTPVGSDDLYEYLGIEDSDRRIVGLSTCADGTSTSRTVVFAYIID